MKLKSTEPSYHDKTWEVMNELDMFPSKLIILKHLLESVQTSIIKRDINLTEYLLDAAQDLVEHYTGDFEKKFQRAWHQVLQIANVADEKSKQQPEVLGNSLLTEDRISNFPGEQYTEEELNAMCDAAEAKHSKSWTVPVEETPDGEALISFPDDLIEKVGWVEDDILEWIDNEDGTFTLKKA